MRRALLVLLVLAGCASPTGRATETCDASWRDVDSMIVTPGGANGEPVALECIRAVGTYRIRIGFVLPPGPSCHGISAIDVVEGGDAVSVIVRLAENDDPAAGACPDEARRATTEIDLQAPVAERALLDGSR
jgi:hypothetical protein